MDQGGGRPSLPGLARGLLLALSLGAAGMLGACAPRLMVLERSWAQPADLQAAAGVELCTELLAQGARRPDLLVLELEILDAQGAPVRSRMPEIADARGNLFLRRSIPLEPRADLDRSICTFLPLEALPEPRGPSYTFQVLLRDAKGNVLSYHQTPLLLSAPGAARPG